MWAKAAVVVLVLGAVAATLSGQPEYQGPSGTLALGLAPPTASTTAQPTVTDPEPEPIEPASPPELPPPATDPAGTSPSSDEVSRSNRATVPVPDTAPGEVRGNTSTTAPPLAPSTSADPPPSTTWPPVDLSRYPGPHNTGVPPGTKLVSTGTLVVDQDGAVIDGFEVTGVIEVRARDVTIRRTRVLAHGPHGILHDASASSLIEDVEVVGVSGELSVGISSHGTWTARRVEVHGFVDGIKVMSNQVVEDSYIHDTLVRPGSHNDGIQSTGGSNVRIVGNRIEGPYQQGTSAILIASSISGPLFDYRIEGNLLSGGTYTFYCNPGEAGVDADPRGIVVRNNVWITDSWKYGPAAVTRTQMVFEGNRYSDGSPFVG